MNLTPNVGPLLMFCFSSVLCCTSPRCCVFVSLLPLSDVPFSLLYFGSYGYLRQKFQDDQGNLSMKHSVICGLSAGIVASGAVTPADVIKTRLQSKTPEGMQPYTGIMNTASRIVANEGFPALFKGVLPRILVISPLFAITLAIFEIQKTLLKKMGH